MTNAQHLIENIIMGMESRIEINSDINTKYTSCTLEEAKEMAEHIVYSLYDGLLPKDVEKMKDRVEVVRCKDCKYNKRIVKLCGIDYVDCKKAPAYQHLEHFCSDGERRTDD